MTEGDRLIREIRNCKVVVIHPPDEDRVILSHQLRRIGCQVSETWPVEDASLEGADAIYFLANPDQTSDLSRLSDKHDSALIAVVSYENPLVLQAITNIGVHGVMTKPIRSIGVLANLITALSIFKYEGRLNSRIAKLDETLKARRMVERATRILAEHQSITEDHAYALIRTEAMSKQVTISEMANSIINTDEIFKK